jgi:hypothetical protein
MSFPRKEGRCKLFKIPNEVFYTANEKHDYKIPEIALEKGLEYLQNEDLVFGDLAEYEYMLGSVLKNRYVNTGLAIYDGERLVNLYLNLIDHGSLHAIFQVIKNGVPTDYWRDYIKYNYFVWFDVSPVYEEIIANITVDDSYIHTYFHYEGGEYYIYLADEGEDIEKFKECLSESRVLPFSCTLNWLTEYKTNILYLDTITVKQWLKNVENYPKYEIYRIGGSLKSAKK